MFADDWMSGTIARRAGLWVHELAEIEAIELNPKQELLETGGYGNCVRLPYPAAGAGTVRQVMWADRSTPLEIDDWLDQVRRVPHPSPIPAAPGSAMETTTGTADTIELQRRQDRRQGGEQLAHSVSIQGRN